MEHMIPDLLISEKVCAIITLFLTSVDLDLIDAIGALASKVDGDQL